MADLACQQDFNAQQDYDRKYLTLNNSYLIVSHKTYFFELWSKIIYWLMNFRIRYKDTLLFYPMNFKIDLFAILLEKYLFFE